MNRNLLIWLIVCVAILIAGVVGVGILGGGLDREIVAKGKAEASKFSQAEKDLAQSRVQIESWLKQEPRLFQARELGTQWKAQLDDLAIGLKQGQTDLDQLLELIDENNEEKAEQVGGLISRLATTRMATAQGAASIYEAAHELIEFQRQIKQKLPQMEQNIKPIRAFDVAVLQTQIDQAASDWPEKKRDLEARRDSLVALQKNALQVWENTAAARQQAAQDQLEADEVSQLVEAANSIRDAKQALGAAPDQLRKRIDQLYWSWDKTFKDMEIVENSTVTFRHQFRTTKVRALVPDGQPAKTIDLPSEWSFVSKQKFEAMKPTLGMVVEHKPAGKYDEESERVVQPPGYAYVASRDQGRNQYGQWRSRSNGTSFWVFYGQYAMFRSIMGGPRYMVTGSMYNDYGRYRQRGVPYYGQGASGRKLYGTSGTVTKSKYATSKYVSSGGFKNTKYVQRGGNYRGSAYDRSAKTSRTSNARSTRSYSTRSSGSRSGGGK